MEQIQPIHGEQLPHQSCLCKACLFRPKIQFKTQPSDVNAQHSFDCFLKNLPPSFPILLQQTVILQYRQEGALQYHSFYNYSNCRDQKRKWMIVKQQLRSISSMPSANVTVYFKNREKIVPRLQAVNYIRNGKFENATDEAVYIQPYQPRPTIRTAYHYQTNSLPDQLLVQHLKKQQERYRNPSYKPNEEFLQWVYRQYGEQTFCHFLTQLYVRLFKALTNHTITNSIFFWALEPLRSSTPGSMSGARSQYEQIQSKGRPRKLGFKPKLVNVRGLEINYYQKLYSFQDQYSDLIKKRIYDSTKKCISAIKNKGYRSRLQMFRQKIQQAYQKQQSLVMSKVQQQRSFEFQQDSQHMARMLIPNLPLNKTLRQVLSDETAFRRLMAKKDNRKRLKTEPSNIVLPSMNKNKTKIDPNWTSSNKLSRMESTSVHKRYYKLLKTPSTHEK